MGYHDLRALLVKRFNLPKERLARTAVRRFTLAEKAVFYFLVLVFVLSGFVLVLRVNKAFLAEVPLQGGTLTEGIIGNPRFINPVLAVSQADKDLSALVYSGLTRTTQNGKTANDLADNISISKDGLVYTVHINPKARFHDDTAVTADDVIFTIEKIEDPEIKSPRFADWSGVSVQKVDDATLTFSLRKPYIPFKENLSLGIMPKHIWSEVSDDEFAFSQFNSLPIGAGPYKIGTAERDSGGIPNYYRLDVNKEVLGQEAYIEHLVFKFYSSEDALLEAFAGGDVQSLSGISPNQAVEFERGGAKILSADLPRVFGVFFNQNQSKPLLQKEVRQALDLTAPRDTIIKSVLKGYGSVIDGPLPQDVLISAKTQVPIDETSRLEKAKSLLSQAGWKPNSKTHILEKKIKNDTISLSFSISTSDTDELKATAQILKETWSRLGAQVEVHVFEPGDLNQNVIRPRHYEALLFGEVVGRDADVYPFWHSSERNDPGLNIALYANSKVDKLIESARTESDESKREIAYQGFEKAIREDVPAVFLYAPRFLYILPASVHLTSLGKLSAPEDRFEGLRDWYIDTDRVWQLFVKNS